jgi:WD40 repeat protein
MRFDQDDSKLITASLDTSIIVWDIISESSLFKFSYVFFFVKIKKISRLTGHKNAITQIENFKYRKENSNIEYDLLLSSSKDGLFKVNI